MRCATDTGVFLKSVTENTYLEDSEYLGGVVGTLLGTTLGFHDGAGVEQTWTILPVATGDKVYIKSHRGMFLTDTGGTTDVANSQGAAEDWRLLDAGDGKVYLQGASGQYFENHQGDISMSLTFGSVQKWEILMALDNTPACITLGGIPGGKTPPADAETIAPGYCVNFNEGGSAGRASGMSHWGAPIEPEECFQKCRNDPMCLQAVYEQSGPEGPQCWTGVNTMPVKPAASRPGAMDHCMAKHGFNAAPDTFTRIGNGSCPATGMYASGVPADALDINVCKQKCLSESECKYISFKQGVTCNRFNGGAGTCTITSDDHVSFRRDPAQLYSYFPLGAGKCALGWYTDGNSMDSGDLTACQARCSLEPQCKFFAFNPGKSCSRFSATAAPCVDRPTGQTDHSAYRKDAAVAPGFPMTTVPPRSFYRTSFGRCIFDEFVQRPWMTPSVNALPCYVDCLKFKASYAPRMCQRMCVNGLMERGLKSEDADNTCRDTCPTACDKVWIAPYICPAPTTTAPPVPPTV